MRFTVVRFGISNSVLVAATAHRTRGRSILRACTASDVSPEPPWLPFWFLTNLLYTTSKRTTHCTNFLGYIGPQRARRSNDKLDSWNGAKQRSCNTPLKFFCILVRLFVLNEDAVVAFHDNKGPSNISEQTRCQDVELFYRRSSNDVRCKRCNLWIGPQWVCSNCPSHNCLVKLT